MIKRFALVAMLFGLSSSLPTYAFGAPSNPHVDILAQASVPPLFDTENAAQAHCPRDVVVWLNVPSGIYHYRGERWYGRTKHGAYACEKEAIKAGDRASLN